MTRGEIKEKYFIWLADLVCRDRDVSPISYDKLLMALHDTEFRYSIPKDQNRAIDGEGLRYRFATSRWYIGGSQEDILRALEGPCSVLEMMVALAVHCEEDIMDDPRIGNRTGQWFWNMIVSLGLGSMHDNRFDEEYVYCVIEHFLDRDYEPNGKGGLFTVRHCSRDLRTAEIWHQLCWYLDEIT